MHMTRILVVCGLMVALVQSGTAAADGEPDDARQLARDNTAFALDLYGQVRGEDGNLFFSPYSVSTALAMTAAGARGATAAEMREALRFSLDPERLPPAFQSLAARLEALEAADGIALRIANSLWPQVDYPLLETYVEQIRTAYAGAIQAVDYVQAAEAARETINRWVEARTEDRIKNLIPGGVLNAMTRLVLVNAIYFKGDWTKPFDPDGTVDAPFRTLDGNRVTVPMMAQQTDFRYAEEAGVQALELPYGDDGELAMLILLPAEPDGLAALEAELTPEVLNGWTARLRSREVSVFLPRFKLTRSLTLNRYLQALGIRLAFQGGAADFSGMDGQSGNLFIDSVLHKAFVEVNEEGTEAAAATAVVMRLTMVVDPPPVFRADRPFLFLIRECATGSILFMGRLADPAGGGD